MEKRLLLKKYVLCCAVALISFAANAQWTSLRHPYGGAYANDGAVAFTFANQGYICAGSSTGEIFEYITNGNLWANVSTAPTSMGHAFAFSFQLNGKGYVIGGDSAGYRVASVYEFDPVAAGWTRKGDFPGGKRDAGYSFAIGNFGYIGGGLGDSTIMNDLWKYDPSNDSWAQEPHSLPFSAGLIFPSSFVLNNKGYVVSGGTGPSGVNETQSMWAFDPATGNWSVKADCPGKARQAAFAFSNSNYAYLAGGQSNYTTMHKDMWRYNPANDHWDSAGIIPLFGVAWSSVYVIGNTAYAGLGAKFQGSGLTGLDDFYKFEMDASTGFSSVNAANDTWVLYPDPARDKLFIKGDLNPEDKISILDLSGRVVKTIDIRNGDGIAVDDLASGVYLLQIVQGNSIAYKRFIKE